MNTDFGSAVENAGPNPLSVWISRIDKAYRWAHARVLGLLLLVFCLAIFLPSLGLFLHDKSVVLGTLQSVSWKLTVPGALLSVLLINAGFGLEFKASGQLARAPLLFTAVVLNGMLPLLMGAVASHLGLSQSLCVALVIIASVPIAGSSTAWSQNSGGSISFSLALVILSTVLSPFLSSGIFWAGSLITSGVFREALARTAQQGATSFFLIAVIFPTAIGIGFRRFFSESSVPLVKAVLKLFSFVCLLMLNYVNASLILPRLLEEPNFANLGLTLLTAIVLCALMFSVGWWLPSLFQGGRDRGTKIATLFGLGMSNNGAGLVLATVVMRDQHQVLLLILFHNLVQQLGAAYCQSRVVFQAKALAKARLLRLTLEASEAP